MSNAEGAPPVPDEEFGLAIYKAIKNGIARVGMPMAESVSEEDFSVMNPDEVLDYAYESLYDIGIEDPGAWLINRDLI